MVGDCQTSSHANDVLGTSSPKLLIDLTANESIEVAIIHLLRGMLNCVASTNNVSGLRNEKLQLQIMLEQNDIKSKDGEESSEPDRLMRCYNAHIVKSDHTNSITRKTHLAQSHRNRLIHHQKIIGCTDYSLTCRKLLKKSAVQYVAKVAVTALARLGAEVANDMVV